MIRIFFVFFLVCCLPACGYQITADKVAPDRITLKGGQKIKGDFALYIDGENLEGRYDLVNDECFDKKYPVDFRNAFRASISDAFHQVFAHIDVVETPYSQHTLKINGYDAQILVKAEEMNVFLKQVPGFWDFTVQSEVEYATSLNVYDAGGMVFATTATASDRAVMDGNEGGHCAGAAYATIHVSESALKEIVTTMTQRLAYADEMRRF